MKKTKIKNLEQMMSYCQKHMRFVSTTEEFNGHEGGIWLCAEDNDVYGGKEIYNYYAESKSYELGILNKWEERINSYGWFSEWYDCGTMMLYKL